MHFTRLEASGKGVSCHLYGTLLARMYFLFALPHTLVVCLLIGLFLIVTCPSANERREVSSTLYPS